MWLCDLDTRNRCQVAFCLNLLIWLGCLAQQKTFVPSYKFCLPSIPLEWSCWAEKVNVLDAQWGRGRYVHLEVTHLKRACWTALDSSAGYVESHQCTKAIGEKDLFAYICVFIQVVDKWREKKRLRWIGFPKLGETNSWLTAASWLAPMTWSSLPVLAGFSSNLLIFCCSWHLKWFLSKFELPALIWVCTDDISKKLHALHFSFHTLLIISTSTPRMLRVELIFCHPNSILHKYLGGYYLFKNRRHDEVPLNYEFLCQLASSQPCSINNSK